MTPKRIDSHKFRGKRYKIRWLPKPKFNGESVEGFCTNPALAEIAIKTNLTEKQLLATALDEGLHACIWDLDNEAVDEISDSLASLLWRLGFRLKKS